MSKSTSTKSVSRVVSSETNDKPKKQTKKPEPKEEVVPTPAPVVPTPKTKTPKTPKTPKDASAKPVKTPKTPKTPKEPVVESTPEEQEHKEDVSKRRREVTHESVGAEFDSLLDLLRENIEQSRSATGKKTSNVKLLRQLGKRLKVLRADCMRISKQRRTNRKNNTSSGFMKPVKVSDEMAKFAGWDPAQLKSRIEATKYICQYIKDNNLQNPDDKRKINPDARLSKLLGYTPSSENPLYYYTIQQKIQKHFKNPDA